MSKRSVVGQAGVLLSLFITCTAHASWWRIWDEHFSSDPSNRWTYAGAANGQGQALMRYDAAHQRIHAEWDQANLFSDAGDPYTLINSRLSAALPRVLTDRDTFRLGATLVIEPGSYPDTTEIFQIGNVGLYNLAQMGPDRTLSDNFSGNASILKDGSDFVEFNYFINNAWGGPNITSIIGAHIDGNVFDYTAGTNSTQTALGEGHWLPDSTSLFVELAYHGSATGALARCARAAIFTDAARTNLLVVNGVTMAYWTAPLPPGKSFTLTDVAFFNYPSGNWGGANGTGTGSFDDVHVDLDLPDGTLADLRSAPGGVSITWSCVSGATYSVLSAPDPSAAQWTTTAVKQALADFLTVTNFLSAPRAVWAIRREATP